MIFEFAQVADFIHAHIGPEFHDKKFAKLRALTLEDILKRKNPYLFRAKNATMQSTSSMAQNSRCSQRILSKTSVQAG